MPTDEMEERPASAVAPLSNLLGLYSDSSFLIFISCYYFPNAHHIPLISTYSLSLEVDALLTFACYGSQPLVGPQ